ncbi:hypothetical protein BN2475_320095 [Paraburkholderia ribeironis]|uniref:Uncharacterized protein n=1 Tax=Paraburkholderia ribeironis TaxID=1247936 RepID=A0A1N7S4K7_9BURK|nr:hypothetical protein BN2475_320095 [Paraburkholderia ribeironis]
MAGVRRGDRNRELACFDQGTDEATRMSPQADAGEGAS